VVTYDVVPEEGATLVTVTQEGDGQTPDSIAQYEETWAQMLAAFKDVVERDA
jgi:hypothetical protein